MRSLWREIPYRIRFKLPSNGIFKIPLIVPNRIHEIRSVRPTVFLIQVLLVIGVLLFKNSIKCTVMMHQGLW